MSAEQARILIVDDEEAILETMTFTFMDVYEVITTSDSRRALDLMDEHGPIAVVITDQRMPEMTGVELLEKVYERYPDTVRIILTGFADSENAIRAINDGHVYAYINKPWEPDELKAIVRRAVEHYELAAENRRLVQDLQNANYIMEAVMDRLDVGAIAIDETGVVRAANAPVRDFLALSGELRGRSIDEVMKERGLEALCTSIKGMADEDRGGFEDHDLSHCGSGHRLRVSAQQLKGPDGEGIGRVVFFKEISHEPLRRQFEEIMGRLADERESLREHLNAALADLDDLAKGVGTSGITSHSMAELGERVSRSQTAIQNWLDVDDTLARDEYPDAQGLLDRMRVASERWPKSNGLPGRVQALADRVAAYYESGENPRERVL